MNVGYALSSEEHPPLELVRNACLAEAAGFRFALISDHFHPWIDRQGQSPFVWSVIAAIAVATKSLRLGTGVTCPTIRIHPAIIAQAAATAASMMPGRFFLGVGTGENLNEHVVGNRWRPAAERREMLREAIAVMRRLWKGDPCSFEGTYYKVDNARIYTLPEADIELAVAASGLTTAELAAEVGEGLIATAPDAELIERYESWGGDGPSYGQLTVCWAKSESEARRTALEWWPNGVLRGRSDRSSRSPAISKQQRRWSQRTMSRRLSSAAPIATLISRASRASPMRGSTTCTCTRSGRIRLASSTSTNGTSLPTRKDSLAA
jgi:G6PDH family F420-dependent oxidoreductase